MEITFRRLYLFICLLSYHCSSYLKFSYFSDSIFVVHDARLSYLSSQIGIDGNNERVKITSRLHKNKYDNFSKKEVDPLKLAIKKAEEESLLSKIDLSAPVRGTTVPVIHESPKLENKIAFENISNIIPSDPYTFGYIRIGVISGSHGVRGELKVQMETDFGDYRVRNGSLLYVKRPNRLTPRPIRVISGRKQNDNIYLIRFSGVLSRLGADAFRGFTVFAKSDDRPTLSVDEYLIRDLIGLKCYLNSDFIRHDNSTLKLLQSATIPIAEVAGVVTPQDLCEGVATAALMHAMLELKIFAPESSISDSAELCLIPLVPQIVTLIDINTSIIILDPPIGLLDMTYREKIEKLVLRGFLPAVASVTNKQRKELQASQTIIKSL